MKRWKAIWMLASAMALAAVGATEVRAQGLTITDNGVSPNVPHPARIRFEQFSTTLTATPPTTPTVNAEETIAGPQYLWSGGSTLVPLTSTTGQTVGLDSGFPPSYGQTKGRHNFTVNCTARFTVTNAAGVRRFIDVSGSKEVEFFIRVPEIAFGTARRWNDFVNGDTNPLEDQRYDPQRRGYWPAYGHESRYELQVRDNQNLNLRVGQRQPYGNGLPREQFSGFPLNGDGGGATWNLAYLQGTGSPTANFRDTLTIVRFNHPPATELTEWWDVLRGSASQAWHCMEYRPPFNSPMLYVQPGRFGEGGTEQPNRLPTSGDFLPHIEDTGLGVHSVQDYWGYAVRTGSDHYPYVDTLEPEDALPPLTF